MGNDFVVIDARRLAELDWPALAVEVCDRHTGIGADGLLVLDSVPEADIRMRMFNPDGSPDICGNGLRCTTRYLLDRRIALRDHVRIATFGGVRAARARRDAAGRVAEVTVDMGEPVFEPAGIPMTVDADRVIGYDLMIGHSRALRITALSTGSTHCVTFGQALPDDDVFLAVSPLVEHHPLFPERTSLMWCAVEGPHRLSMRIWERGGGETLGCGTGACAAAVAAIVEERIPAREPVTVTSRGGSLTIRWQPDADMQLTGPAEFVYEGVYTAKEATSDEGGN